MKPEEGHELVLTGYTHVKLSNLQDAHHEMEQVWSTSELVEGVRYEYMYIMEKSSPKNI
jgi:hypothetical protein